MGRGTAFLQMFKVRDRDPVILIRWRKFVIRCDPEVFLLSIKTTWLMHQIQRQLRWSDNIFSLHKCIPHGSERLQGVCDTFVYGDAIDSILYVWFSCFTFVFSWALGWFIGLGLCILIYNSCAKSYMLNTI
jgi:hypothetical protein